MQKTNPLTCADMPSFALLLACFQYPTISYSRLIASRLEARTAYISLLCLFPCSGPCWCTGFSGVKRSRHEAAHACLWLVRLVRDLQYLLQLNFGCYSRYTLWKDSGTVYEGSAHLPICIWSMTLQFKPPVSRTSGISIIGDLNSGSCKYSLWLNMTPNDAMWRPHV